ncbi:MAG: hypothetical protein COA42_23665 [Alteromonadaceae bacterium]|nr:MAG: hypothetical protein COA42_23665 [Alteromonadaceae bacterium]
MTNRKTPKPKQIGVTEDVKTEIDALCEMRDLSQSELMDELWKLYKKENPEHKKRVTQYVKMKAELLSKLKK